MASTDNNNTVEQLVEYLERLRVTMSVMALRQGEPADVMTAFLETIFDRVNLMIDTRTVERPYTLSDEGRDAFIDLVKTMRLCQTIYPQLDKKKKAKDEDADADDEEDSD